MTILDFLKTLSFWEGVGLTVIAMFILWGITSFIFSPITSRLDKLIKNKKEIEEITKERDAALRDLTKMCTMYRIITVCELCAHDSCEQDCGKRHTMNVTSNAMNICWEWRGPK